LLLPTLATFLASGFKLLVSRSEDLMFFTQQLSERRDVANRTVESNFVVITQLLQN
jgi:hypothetical protein